MTVSLLAALGCLLALNVMGVSFKQGGEAQRYDHISLWAISLMVLRAGVVEELFYRAYLMERLEEFSGRRMVYFLLPAVVFGLLHFRQGIGGMLISFVLGLILAWFYWRQISWHIFWWILSRMSLSPWWNGKLHKNSYNFLSP